MPDLKISQLTAGSLAQAGDEIPIARSGANYKITGANIAAAATSVGTLTSLTLSGNVTLNATNGVVQIVTPTADQPQIRMRMSGTNGVLDVTRNSGTAPDLIFGTEGAEKMRLDANGNLGIGTPSPAYPLHVERASYGMTGYFFTNDGTRNPRLAIYGSSSGTTIQHTFSTAADALMFAVGGAIGSGTEVMRLDSNGNLLVGASSNPGVLSKSLVVDSGSNTLAGLVLQNNTTGRTSTDGSVLYISGSTLALLNQENDALTFGTNNAERARITSAGGFSVGTTTDLGAGNIAIAAGKYLGYSASAYMTPEDNVQGALIKTPGGIVFEAGGSERARITSGGSMVVGTAAIATTATDGFLYVPTCAGTPTGTPTTQTGTAPIVVDTTNNKLYFYSGGSWRDAGP